MSTTLITTKILSIIIGANTLLPTNNSKFIEYSMESLYPTPDIFIEDDGSIVITKYQTIKRSKKAKIRVTTYTSELKILRDTSYDVPKKYNQNYNYYKDGFYYVTLYNKASTSGIWDGPEIIQDTRSFDGRNRLAKNYTFYRINIKTGELDKTAQSFTEQDGIWFNNAFIKNNKLYLAANNETTKDMSLPKREKMDNFSERYKYMGKGYICEVDFNANKVKLHSLPYEKSAICRLVSQDSSAIFLVATNTNITDNKHFDYRLGELTKDGYKEIGELNILNNSLKIGSIKGIKDGTSFITTTTSETLEVEGLPETSLTEYSIGEGPLAAKYKAYMEDMPCINFTSVVNGKISTKSYFLEHFREQLDSFVELKNPEIMNSEDERLDNKNLTDRRFVFAKECLKRTVAATTEYICLYTIYKGYMEIEEYRKRNAQDNGYVTLYRPVRHIESKAFLVVCYNASGNIIWNRAFAMLPYEEGYNGYVVYFINSNNNIIIKTRDEKGYNMYTIDVYGNIKENDTTNLEESNGNQHYYHLYYSEKSLLVHKLLFGENPPKKSF